MKISEITEANTPNIAAMVNGKPVQREAGRDPVSTKPYNKKHKDHNRKTQQP
jgi:hypothetical protein